MWIVRSKNALGTSRVTSFVNSWPSRRKKNAKNGASSSEGSDTAADSSASPSRRWTNVSPNSVSLRLISAWKSIRRRNPNCASRPSSVLSIRIRPPSRYRDSVSSLPVDCAASQGSSGIITATATTVTPPATSAAAASRPTPPKVRRRTTGYSM